MLMSGFFMPFSTVALCDDRACSSEVYCFYQFCDYIKQLCRYIREHIDVVNDDFNLSRQGVNKPTVDPDYLNYLVTVQP